MKPRLSKPIYFKNAQWAVTSYGVECITTSYPIEKSRLWQDWPNYSWEQHMREKNWVSGPLFDEAMNYAYQKFKSLKPTRLKESA